MKLSQVGEFGLINRIAKTASRTSASALVGIGDDAAALSLSASQTLLATTDVLLEDVHFDLSFTDFYSLGWKSAAVNLSDIAAMGGVPRFCLTALGIPARISVEQVLDFYRGFNALLRRHATALVGGDTCASGEGLFISVTALGEAEPRRIITRSGAQPGDLLFVTGALGDSAAGLEILKRRGVGRTVRNSGAGAKRLIEKHLRPVPRVSEGRKIALSGCASAMIDISDGLSSDLWHICEQSGVGAEIISDRLPISTALGKTAKNMTKHVLHYALSGGEDYELLFTVPHSRMKKLSSLEIGATEIGIVTPGTGVFLIDGKGERTPLAPSGYDHFRSAASCSAGASQKGRFSRKT